MKFGRDIKEVSKIISSDFPDKDIIAREQRIDVIRDFGVFPRTQITLVFDVQPKEKKKTIIQRIQSYFK